MKNNIICFFVLSFMVLSLVAGCASPPPVFRAAESVNNENEASIIIKRKGADNNGEITVFIDNFDIGHYVGSLNSKSPVLMYKLFENTKHAIQFEFSRRFSGSGVDYLGKNWDAWYYSLTRGSRYDFSLDGNNQYVFTIEKFRGSDGNYYLDVKTETISLKAPEPPRPPEFVVSDDAIKNSFNAIAAMIPNGSKIALLNITSANRDISNFVLEELSVFFVNSKKYTVVDRITLNAIRDEHKFQLTGEVDDASLVSIGQFLGANVVITGAISGKDDMMRLRLKALKVDTAQVIAMSSEKTSDNLKDISLYTATVGGFNQLNAMIPSSSNIAIVNVFSDNRQEGEFVEEELAVLLVNEKKYTVVDRKTLETIKKEQKFQLTGEVDDASVVSIGRFLGANVVITGTIDGSGDRKRLRLKALDVRSAQILAVSSDRI